MSITSGFFNSINGDRKYNAEQMSSLFDGIINDGVFQNIGSAFAVKVAGGNSVTVDTGRAWFDSTWILNDSLYPITLESSEILLDRIDAVVFDVDHNDSVRAGTIKVVKGSASETPINPTLTKEELHKQYPICYIKRKANSTAINQEDITYKVGSSECPFVTGILKTLSVDAMVAQWEDQWNQWFNSKTAVSSNAMNKWQNEQQADYDEWFNNLKTNLSNDVAANLQNQIDELKAGQDENQTITWLKDMVYTNNYWALLVDENGNAIVDENSNTILGNWSYVEKG